MGVQKEVKRITDEIDKLDKLPITKTVTADVLSVVIGYCKEKIIELTEEDQLEQQS